MLNFADNAQVWFRLGLLAALLPIGCNHLSGTQKPRPEPSAGAGIVVAGEPTRGNAGTFESPRPLLLHPGLGEVRVALESQDDELAAVALRARMSEGGDLGKDCRECNYLLGVIEERQGAAGRAVAAFEAAALSDWALRRDAIMHLAALELQRKNCIRAEQLLEQTTSSEPASGARLSGLLLAKADTCQGRWASAMSRLRQLLAGRNDDGSRAELQLLLAQALVEQTDLAEAERPAAEDEALQLAEDAISQPAAAANVLDGAKTLIEQLLLRRQRGGNSDELFRERTVLLEAFVEARRWGEGKRLAEELLEEVSNGSTESQLYCRLLFARGRIAAAGADRQAALEFFDAVAQRCQDADLGARALFIAAGLLGASKRTAAIAKYAELERRYPAHRLADDARLKQAFLYRAAGSESRFVGLLDSMPDDYAKGDMVLEGLFQLALKNMLRQNWPMAQSVLERSERFAAANGAGKDAELDRLKYFLARASIESGKVDVGVKLLRELIVGRPLTYYMLLAHAALARSWPSELEQAEQVGLAGSVEETVPEVAKSAGERQRIARLAALLGVADIKAANALLDEGESDGACESTVFAIAGMYANAGATKTALTLVKRRGRDWRVRWPAAGWVELWKQAFPRPYHAIVRQQAARQGVSETLIYAIMREESEFDPKATSAADAYGLMQLIVPTARTAGRELGISVDARSLQKPSVNIALGSRVLATLGARFSGQVALIAAGYNAGPGRPARWLREYPEVDMDLWIELIEFPETRGYVKRVLESQAAYRWLYGSEGTSGATIDPLPLQLNAGRAG